MQERIAKIIPRLSEKLIEELLATNDEMNAAFIRFHRCSEIFVWGDNRGSIATLFFSHEKCYSTIFLKHVIPLQCSNENVRYVVQSRISFILLLTASH